jgi:hypothetical protein
LGPPASGVLSCLQALLIGAGALGRPIGKYLVSVGISRFVVVDPKRYRPTSTSQCYPDEVGLHKALVVAEKLRRQGARAIALPRALEHVEPGIAGPRSFLVVSTDTLSGQRGAHDVAFHLRLPLFTVHVEPAYLLASLRFFDYSQRRVRCCLVCGWTERHFATQEAATSCEPRAERPTASPRALSAFAAGWAALLIASALTRDDARDALRDREFLLSPLGHLYRSSELTPNPDCRLHTQRRARLRRLTASARDVNLKDLAALAGAGGDSTVRVRGLRARFALRGRCVRCGQEAGGCWWVLDPARPLGRCTCGGRIFAVPYFTFESLSRNELAEHWDRPLAALGAGRRATVSIESESTTTFILA